MDIVIRKYNSSDIDSLNVLLKECYGITKVNNDTNNIELVADYNNEIVGFLTINLLHDSVKNTKYCNINYVCVKKEYRNNDIATRMLEEVFNICRNLDIKCIELTSKSSRIEAHGLYEKVGFIKRDTDVFRKEII